MTKKVNCFSRSCVLIKSWCLANVSRHVKRYYFLSFLETDLEQSWSRHLKNLVEYNKVVFDLYCMQLWVTRSNLSRYLMTQKEGGCAIVEWLRCHINVKWCNKLSLVLYWEKYFRKLWYSSRKWVSENTLVISCYFNQKKVFISNSMRLFDVP